ncbi:MAG: ribosome maturation factor RimM [Bacteroidales bacterium]|nr:ribosome maturation factor RimM [Bacteroidales bacterium]
MIREDEVYLAGVLNKPHGTKGELQFTIADDAFMADDEEELDFIFCRLDGILVPFYVEEYRFRSDTTMLLKLEGIDTEADARRLTGVEVYAKQDERTPAEDEPLTWSFFRGCTVEDVQAGNLGKITLVDNSTLNTLFIIKQGDKELMVPAQEDFIVSIDRAKRHIVMNLPTGLLTLNDPDKAKEEVY